MQDEIDDECSDKPAPKGFRYKLHAGKTFTTKEGSIIYNDQAHSIWIVILKPTQDSTKD